MVVKLSFRELQLAIVVTVESHRPLVILITIQGLPQPEYLPRGNNNKADHMISSKTLLWEESHRV